MANLIILMAICFPVIAESCTVELYREATEICDGGEEIWTVGYGNRSLKAFVDHENCSVSKLEEDYLWCLGYPKCLGIAYVGVKDNNANLSAEWLISNDTHLVSTLEFYNVLDDSEPKLFYSLRHIDSKPPSYGWNITIKHCPRQNEMDVEILDSEGSYLYGNMGNFTCPNTHRLINIVDNQIETNSTTSCGTCAYWERMEEMDCWRVPNATIKRSFINKTFLVGDQLTTEICDVIDDDRLNGSVVLFYNNSVLSTPFTLRPIHNNMTVYCKVENELTRLMNKSGEFSEAYSVVVEFGPINYSEWTSCTHIEAGTYLYNVTLHVSFSVNPPTDKPVILDDSNKMQNFIFKSTYKSAECCKLPIQNNEIKLINTKKKNTVSIEFNHKVKTLTLLYNDVTENCAAASTMSTSTTPKPVASANMSDTTIAVICAGAVIVVILITGFLTLHFRKKGLTGESSSARPNQPSVIEMTVDLAQTDLSKPEKKVEEGYEIPIVHTYEKMKPAKNGLAYENVDGARNLGFDEDTAYAL